MKTIIKAYLYMYLHDNKCYHAFNCSCLEYNNFSFITHPENNFFVSVCMCLYPLKLKPIP